MDSYTFLDTPEDKLPAHLTVGADAQPRNLTKTNSIYIFGLFVMVATLYRVQEG